MMSRGRMTPQPVTLSHPFVTMTLSEAKGLLPFTLSEREGAPIPSP